MRIYEFFRKTKETYICMQINLDGSGISNININIFFFKHMMDQFIINSLFNFNVILIGDSFVDYHHIVEDFGISLGKLLKGSINKKLGIVRYGYSYVPLDESLSRVVIDFSGRSYLMYNVFYSRLYLGNLDIDIFYDFFLSFTENLGITLYIDNLYGENIHHKIETIFKALGTSIKIALYSTSKIISTKGVLY